MAIQLTQLMPTMVHEQMVPETESEVYPKIWTRAPVLPTQLRAQNAHRQPAQTGYWTLLLPSLPLSPLPSMKPQKLPLMPNQTQLLPQNQMEPESDLAKQVLQERCQKLLVHEVPAAFQN